MSVNFFLDVDGLDRMQLDFGRLSAREPMAAFIEKADAALGAGFAATQALVPEDSGDYRRPGGALKASGRTESGQDLDSWEGSASWGDDTDAMPYAVWARWKHHGNTGVDYLDGMDAAVEPMDAAVDEYFSEVFPDAERREI